MEPTPLVYARSVTVPLAPLEPTLADHVRCSVSAVTGVAVKARTIANETRIATPRRRVLRMSPSLCGSWRRAVASSRNGERTRVLVLPQGEYHLPGVAGHR